MKRLLLVATLALASSAQAAEVIIGTLTATTTVNNTTTAVVFSIPPKTAIMVQCDAAAYITWGSTTSTAATAANGKYMVQYAEWDTNSTDSKVYLAALSVSGTANCKVFRVEP